MYLLYVYFICQAIVGEIGMDATLENISKALYNGVLPEEWSRLAPDSRKPLAGWIEHFERRKDQYTDWVCKEEMLIFQL